MFIIESYLGRVNILPMCQERVDIQVLFLYALLIRNSVQVSILNPLLPINFSLQTSYNGFDGFLQFPGRRGLRELVRLDLSLLSGDLLVGRN